MKERKQRRNRELHPLIRIPLGLIVSAGLLFLALSAVKFCLGLFLTGDYIVSFPWSSSPVVQESLLKPGSKNPTQPTEGEDGVQISYATISVAGDLMTHMPVVRSGGENYDYTEMFTYLSKYLETADYAVANLEATLSGTDNGHEYTGSPNFNAPDAIADHAKKAGFDLLLTGNEHCNDYGTYGLKRTLDILKNRGLDTLGTVGTSEDQRYIIRDLNGIQVGMVCYTYADTGSGRDTPTINGAKLDSSAAGLLNAFDYGKLNTFYGEMETHIAAMKEAGAEAIVVYLHWGNEYSLKIGSRQTEMAQKLCDMGVDVIAGSHTHTVQPVELLTSTVDESHTTVCMHSVGNLVSNQRADNSAMTSGHTEDGLVFSFTLAKNEAGDVWVNSIDILPIWVLLRGTGNERTFQILPLDSDLNWKTVFQLSTEELHAAQSSYSRTSEQVNTGVRTVSVALEKANALRSESDPQ